MNVNIFRYIKKQSISIKISLEILILIYISMVKQINLLQIFNHSYFLKIMCI